MKILSPIYVEINGINSVRRKVSRVPRCFLYQTTTQCTLPSYLNIDKRYSNSSFVVYRRLIRLPEARGSLQLESTWQITILDYSKRSSKHSQLFLYMNF